MLKRRSLRIGGHATSVSLEDPFWEELRRAAEEDGMSLSALVTAIDAERCRTLAGSRPALGLSAALRLHVLNRLREARDKARER